jgi:predicted DNA-binding transcriptional regulator AlpA
MNEKAHLTKLLTPQQVSNILGISVETLNVWRATKRYKLPYTKIGHLVRYRSHDIETFIQERTVN